VVLVLTFADAIRAVSVGRTVAGDLTGNGQRLTPGHPVGGLAIVAAAACTLRDMALRNTFRIGATLQLGTDIAALGHPIGCGACSVRGTVLVGLALDGAATALVVRITNESRGTGALVRPPRVPATGSGSARSIATKVDDIATHARISRESWLAVAYLLVVLGGAEGILSTRLSDEAGDLAHMVVAALVIRAVIIAAALDLAASGLGVPEESLFAEAVGSMGTGHTFGIPATCSTTQAHGLTLGPAIGITETSLILATLVIRSAVQLLCANVIRTELELGAGGVRLAGSLADSLQTQLFRDAITIGAAQGTADAMGADASLGTLSILLAVLQLHASQLGISGTSSLTGAHSNVVLHRATSLSSTGIGQGTGIDALRVQAGLLP